MHMSIMVVKNKYLRDNIMKLKDLLKESYKLGDMWSNDFDYKGMLQMGAKANVNMNEKNLQKLYDSYEDVNYHSENRFLGMAIDALRDGDKKLAAKHLKDFNRANVKTLKNIREGKLSRAKLTERLSSSTVRRMDGLHNVKAMKQMLVGAEVIVNDLVEEGFDEMEVLAYLIEKIKKSAL